MNSANRKSLQWYNPLKDARQIHPLFYAKDIDGEWSVSRISSTEKLGKISFKLDVEEGKDYMDYLDNSDKYNIESLEWWRNSAVLNHREVGYFEDIPTAMCYLDKLEEFVSTKYDLTQGLIGFKSSESPNGYIFSKTYSKKRHYTLFVNENRVWLTLQIGNRKCWENLLWITNKSRNYKDTFDIPSFWPNFVDDPINLGINIALHIIANKERYNT
jgi:hypothetical protein